MFIKGMPWQNACYKSHSPDTLNQKSNFSPQKRRCPFQVRIKPTILCTSYKSVGSQHSAHSISSQCPQLPNEETGTKIPGLTQQTVRELEVTPVCTVQPSVLFCLAATANTQLGTLSTLERGLQDSQGTLKYSSSTTGWPHG